MFKHHIRFTWDLAKRFQKERSGAIIPLFGINHSGTQAEWLW